VERPAAVPAGARLARQDDTARAPREAAGAERGQRN
jgi:hypothetical protein